MRRFVIPLHNMKKSYITQYMEFSAYDCDSKMRIIIIFYDIRKQQRMLAEGSLDLELASKRLYE